MQIAVDNMANAIKKISIQRGYNVAEYALCCFGGAGGQHACLVADALGVKRIFIHPYAGVLSAYGMGLADLRVLRETTVEATLDSSAMENLKGIFDQLEADGRSEMRAQDVGDEYITVVHKIHLRYQGTDSPLIVDYGSYDEMLNAFEAVHQQRFGFVSKDRALIVGTASVEVIGTMERVSEEVLTTQQAPTPEPVAQSTIYSDAAEHQTPLWQREHLRPADQVEGPAVILEATGTTVIEPGWRAELMNSGQLLLERVVPLTRRVAVGTEVDPVLLEIFNNLFMSVAEQMGVALQNTASSVNIKERLDFSCAGV